jgi:hypothetical protein
MIFLWKLDWRNQSPCSTLKTIQFIDKEWVLETHKGKKQHYVQAEILISPILFQLLEFSNQKQKKRIVLFCDQISEEQVRLLHLKTKLN